MPTEPIDLIERIKAIHAESQVAQGRYYRDNDFAATSHLSHAIDLARYFRQEGIAADLRRTARRLCQAHSLTCSDTVKSAIEALLGDCLLAAMNAHKE